MRTLLMLIIIAVCAYIGWWVARYTAMKGKQLDTITSTDIWDALEKFREEMSNLQNSPLPIAEIEQRKGDILEAMRKVLNCSSVSNVDWVNLKCLAND